MSPLLRSDPICSRGLWVQSFQESEPREGQGGRAGRGAARNASPRTDVSQRGHETTPREKLAPPRAVGGARFLAQLLSPGHL